MVSLWQIFGVFAKIGTFTIGGGYAMIPIIEDELKRRNWIDPEEIDDVVVLAQSASGLLAVNMAIFSGYKIRGLKGSIAATVGSVFPSFFIILAIAMAFTNFQDNPIVIRIFSGIRPVVVALIASPMISMARKSNKSLSAWLISIISLVLVAFLDISPIYIILTVLVIAYSIAKIKEKQTR